MSDSDSFPTRCLVDGCDRGPFESLASLRGHINASGAAGHEWSTVKDQLDTSDEQAKAGDGSGDGETNDTEEETSESEGEAAPEESDQEATTNDEGDMPTQEEYEQQHTTSGSEGKSGDGSGDGTTNDQGSTTSGSPLSALPMDPKTLGMLLAVAVVLWLSYRALSGSSDDDQPETSNEQAKAGDGSGVESTTETEEIQGGLTG